MCVCVVVVVFRSADDFFAAILRDGAILTTRRCRLLRCDIERRCDIDNSCPKVFCYSKYRVFKKKGKNVGRGCWQEQQEQ